MEWNKFAQEVHQVAVDHGWWEKGPSFAEISVMCNAELSEAVEEYRAGRPMFYYPCNAGGVCVDDVPGAGMTCGSRVYDPKTPEISCKAKSKKPCGVAVEMADCILRILDYLATTGMDIDGEIGFSPALDGLIPTIALCHYEISIAYIQTTSLSGSEDTIKTRLMVCMERILDWAKENNVPMEAVLRSKHEYNKTRPHRHGGKLL